MSNGEIIIYEIQDGQTSIDVKMEGEMVWLSQAQMAELFKTDRTSILRHIQNVYKTGELQESSTCAFFLHKFERRVNEGLPAKFRITIWT